MKKIHFFFLFTKFQLSKNLEIYFLLYFVEIKGINLIWRELWAERGNYFETKYDQSRLNFKNKLLVIRLLLEQR